MIVLTTPDEARAWVADQHAGGRTVGVVPTQGALHAGHGALIDASRDRHDATALTLFVNPFQFRWDKYLAYPRDRDADLALASSRGVDAVYDPGVDAVYPELGGSDAGALRAACENAHSLSDRADRSHHTFMKHPLGAGIGGLAWTIVPGRLALRMDGSHHPWHFDGVATVVERLFHALPGDAAYFGQKDVQQLAIVRALAAWLRGTGDRPVPAVTPVPVHRDDAGLSLSSRHALLDADGRAAARAIAGVLLRAVRTSGAGPMASDTLDAAVRDEAACHNGVRVEYLGVVHPDTLEPLPSLAPPAAVYLAYWVGDLRLAEVVPPEPAHQGRLGGARSGTI